MSEIDDDDRFLITEMYRKKKKTVTYISEKLGHSEDVIKGALFEDFAKQGGIEFKKEEYQQSAYWFFLHKFYILGNTKCSKYDRALRRCEVNYPSFGKFLVGEKANGQINDTTKWSEVNNLWLDKYEEYQPADTETAETLESKIGREGGETISIETEEQHMNAVCKIKCKSGTISGCGSLVNIYDQIGILTSSGVLNNEEDCETAVAIFETIDGEIPIKLTPKKQYLSNTKLRVTFVACTYDENDEQYEELQPLQKISDVKQDAPVYSYFHLNGHQKVSIQQKVTKVESNSIGFDGTPGDGAVGAPLYCGDKVVGVNQREKMWDANVASDINAVANWIKENAGDGIYTIGEEVIATWSDGFPYPAKILRKTEIGYEVHYFQFGDQKEDTPLDKIKKKEQPKSITTTSEKSTTTTMTSTTTSTSQKDNPLSLLDEDDREIIDGCLKRGMNPEEISKKLVSCDPATVNAYIELRGLLDWLSGSVGCKIDEQKFEELGYCSLDILKSWKREEIDGRLQKAGVKPGSRRKIEQQLMTIITYGGENGGNRTETKSSHHSSPSASIGKIQTQGPFPADFLPPDADLTDNYKHPSSGKVSVRAIMESIKNGKLPKGAEPNKPFEFYVKSSGQQRYFKIMLCYEN